MKKIVFISFFLMSALSIATCGFSQEHVSSLHNNAVLSKGGKPRNTRSAQKTTASTLYIPFFEDFTGYSPYPDSNKWVEDEVYINNTMCVSPVSRGVATFDCISQYGTPYDSFNTEDYIFCDSLTSQPIDISLNTPADSLYLSFFYQPQGNGFYPSNQDTLYLFLKNSYGDYVQVWSVAGSEVQPFEQVMIPITDSLYFFNSFQFRFVNYGALDYADADWNIDYIRLDTDRNINDTLVNDIAWSSDPTFLLNDYTSMPYRQFMANPVSETATQYTDSINNDQTSAYFVNYGFMATALNTSTVLQPPAPLSGPLSLPAVSIQPVVFPAYTVTIPASAVGTYDKVVFENTYYLSGTATGNSTNDTIVKDQIFDNYLAYDDGTAEKSYYLNLSPTLDARIAVEYHLNQPDTLRGFAIYFGRTDPLQSYKSFSILVYGALAGINGSATEDTFYQEDYFSPGYIDMVNDFYVYTFTTPVPLPAGTFYVGTLQYAESGDDSLYIGLDVNRIGPNHAYYNVLNYWEPSSISGALMMRPILGQFLYSSAVTNLQLLQNKWLATPNPATNVLQFTFDGINSGATYRISDIMGHVVMQGPISNGNSVDISNLAPGMYLASLLINGMQAAPQKIIKL